MWLRVSVVAVSTWCGLAVAHAQAPFDADAQLRRQAEQIDDVRAKNDATAKAQLQTVAEPDPGLLPQETPCFPIDRVTVTGFQAPRHTRALAGGALNDRPQGRCLGAKGIQILLDRLQNALVVNGYITARVSAPDQELHTGNLTLHIQEGRLGSVQIQSDGAASRAIRASALAAQAGDTLNLRDIEQSLENLRRIHDSAPTMDIVPGREPGESALLIGLQPFKPFRASLGLDDAGVRSTGRLQSNATVHWENPLSLADTLYVHTAGDVGDRDEGPRGQDSHVLHYSAPLGYWSVSVSANRSRYHQQVTGAFQNYRYSGHSRGYDLGVSRVLHRASDHKTSLSLQAFARSSANYIDDTEVVVQRRRTGGWELGVQHQQTFALAELDVDYAYKRGTGAFGALPAPEEAFGEGTARMRRSQLGVRVRLPLVSQGHGGMGPVFTTQWRGQWAHTPLTPQDRFCFGGRHTVRGFDGASSMCGDSGWTSRNEVTLAVPGAPVQLYAALDGGRARGPSAGPSAWLLGWATGVRSAWLLQASTRVQLDAFIGVPLRQPGWFSTSDHTGGFSLQVLF